MSIKKNKINTTFNKRFTSNNNLVVSYLNDIKKYDVMTKEEEIEIFKRIKNGDNKAKEELINKNQRFIFSLAKKYANGDKVIDVVNEGNIAMIEEAIDKYDPSRNVRFLSFAVNYIRRNMNHYIMDTDQFIKKSNFHKTTYKVNRFKDNFFKMNGRLPSENEIIEDMEENQNLSIKCVDDIYDVDTKSISTTYNDDDKNAFENSSLFVDKTSVENDVMKQYNNEETSFILNKIMKVLSERERNIIKMSFGIGYDYEISIDDIAIEFNMTPERIRQIKKDALIKMRNIMPSIINA